MQFNNLVKHNTLNRVPLELKLQKEVMHDCENIARIYDAFTTDSAVCMVLEFCDYGTVESYLKSKHEGSKRISEATAKVLFLQLLNAVNCLQQHNIVHRDIKLQNLLLTQKDRPYGRFSKFDKTVQKPYEPNFVDLAQSTVYFNDFKNNNKISRWKSQKPRVKAEDLTLKLADFGLATKLTDEEAHTRTMCGTPNYVAPEIARHDPHGLPVDIFSCGVVLFTMLTGKPPFQKDSLRETLNMVKNKDVTNEINSLKDVTGECKELLKKMFAKRPEERYKLSQIYNHKWFQTERPEPINWNIREGVDAYETPLNTKKVAKIAKQPKSNKKIHANFPMEFYNSQNQVYSESRKSQAPINELLRKQPNLKHFLNTIDWNGIFPCCQTSHQSNSQMAWLIDTKRKECILVEKGISGIWIKWSDESKDNLMTILVKMEPSFLNPKLENILHERKEKKEQSQYRIDAYNSMEDEKIPENLQSSDNILFCNELEKCHSRAKITMEELWGAGNDYKYKRENCRLLELKYDDIVEINKKWAPKHDHEFTELDQLDEKYRHWYILLHKAIDSIRKHFPQVLVNIKTNLNDKYYRQKPEVPNYYDCCLYFRNGNIIMFFKQPKECPQQHQS